MKFVLSPFRTRSVTLAAILPLALIVSSPGAEEIAAPPVPAAAPVPATEIPAIDIPAVIAKARSYLGTEEALTAIKTVRYEGTVSNQDGTSRKIQVLMERPMMQRMSQTGAEAQEITVLNGYEAWSETITADARRARSVKLLGPNEIRVLRMRTWQTLYYYKDVESVGGEVQAMGEEMFDGVLCVKLAFIHGRGLGYTRYFDKETGRLVVTKSSSGGDLREKGEMFVSGVRFPKEVIESNGNQTSTFVIDRVTVNEEFPASLFEFPILRFRPGAEAPARAPGGSAPPPPTAPSAPAAPPPAAPAAPPAAPPAGPPPTP